MADGLEPDITTSTVEPVSLYDALKSRYVRDFIARTIASMRGSGMIRHEIVFAEPEPGKTRIKVMGWGE